jgi:hypothetical protein
VAWSLALERTSGAFPPGSSDVVGYIGSVGFGAQSALLVEIFNAYGRYAALQKSRDPPVKDWI